MIIYQMKILYKGFPVLMFVGSGVTRGLGHHRMKDTKVLSFLHPELPPSLSARVCTHAWVSESIISDEKH